jgi:hypothetical protein
LLSKSRLKTFVLRINQKPHAYTFIYTHYPILTYTPTPMHALEGARELCLTLWQLEISNVMANSRTEYQH